MENFSEYFDYDEGITFRPTEKPYLGSEFREKNTFRTSFIMDEQGFSKKKKPENNIKHLLICVFLDEKEKQMSLEELLREQISHSFLTYPYQLKNSHPEYLAFSADSALDFRLLEKTLPKEMCEMERERRVYEMMAEEAISIIRSSEMREVQDIKEHYYVFHCGDRNELLLIHKRNGVKTGTMRLPLSRIELDLACQLTEKVNNKSF